jgi:outer membrane biosynthesis protein TonB
MQRKFYLHVQPGSPLIDEVSAVAKPITIFTKDWDAPIRTIPTIQFFPEINELIEGEAAIKKYLETLKPRPMARERLAPIKTKPVTKKRPPTPPKAKAPEPKPEVAQEPTKETKQQEPKKESKPTTDDVIREVRSELTRELNKAKKPRKTVRIQKPVE